MLTGWLPDCTGCKRNFNYVSNWEQNCYCSPHKQWEDDVSEAICEQKLVWPAVCNDIRVSQSCLCLLLSRLGRELGGNTLSVMSPPCCFGMDDSKDLLSAMATQDLLLRKMAHAAWLHWRVSISISWSLLWRERERERLHEGKQMAELDWRAFRVGPRAEDRQEKRDPGQRPVPCWALPGQGLNTEQLLGTLG